MQQTEQHQILSCWGLSQRRRGQNYDGEGLNQEQLINDMLDQYEKHSTFHLVVDENDAVLWAAIIISVVNMRECRMIFTLKWMLKQTIKTMVQGQRYSQCRDITNGPLSILNGNDDQPVSVKVGAKQSITFWNMLARRVCRQWLHFRWSIAVRRKPCSATAGCIPELRVYCAWRRHHKMGTGHLQWFFLAAIKT